MNFSIHILGSSSAVPTRDRNQTALVLDLGVRSVLFDAGEGVQKQMILHNIKPHKITHVVISHLHPDHFIGLIGLLCSWGLLGRHQKLCIVAPKGLQQIIELQLETSGIVLRYPLQFVLPGQNDNDLVLETSGFSLRSYKMKHRIECYGYLLTERKHERRLLPEMLEGVNLPYEAYPVLKSGMDYTHSDGKVYRYLHFTDDPPKSRSFAYFTDTTVQPHLSTYLHGVDLLYHDSTFMSEMDAKAVETGHSTTTQAAEFAALARVEKLILGHFSSRYGFLKPLENEARKIFGESYLAIEGQIFEVQNT
ncbi:ribonuclease Z [bacterium]|nr:ribonuclease Z [bacterium]